MDLITWAVLAALAWLVVQLATARARRFTDVIPEVLAAAEHGKDAVTLAREENAAARVRITQARATKAAQRLAAEKDGKFDAVIIGAGCGGMACAATLARIGYQCCVLEQGEEIGGGSHVFVESGGYEFETGLHYLGKDKDMDKILDFLTCGRLKLADIGTECKTAAGGDGVMYDDVVLDGQHYRFFAGRENLVAELKETFTTQDEHLKIDAFMKHLDMFQDPAVREHMQMFFRLKVVRFLPAWLRGFLQSILAWRCIKIMRMTTEDLLTTVGIATDSRLGMVLIGQYGDTVMPPDSASAMIQLGVMTHYMEGATYPVGGAGQIPRKMNAVIAAGGGCTFVKARVTELIYADGAAEVVGVIVNNEIEIRTRNVISSIGVGRTYRDLIATQFPSLAEGPLSRIYAPEMKYSAAFIFLFLSLDISKMSEADRKKYDQGHNSWVYPDPIGGFAEMEKRLFRKLGPDESPWDRPVPCFVACGSAKDRSHELQKPDKKTVVVLSQCAWSWVEEWAGLTHEEREREPSYALFKENVKEALLRDGLRSVWPELEKYVIRATVGTPLSTNTFLGTDIGECGGHGPTCDHYFVPDFVPYTPVNNLYLTGQDVLSLGIAGSSQSGYLTANAVAGYGTWQNAILQRDIIVDLGLPALF